MKKLAYVFGGIALFFLLVAVIVPLVVDVDQYRPQIVKAANKQINGELEIGKLTLSAWGRFLVKVDGLKIRDSFKQEVVSVADAHLHIPFTALFGSQITFRMIEPKVNVIAGADGSLNVMKLSKATAKTGAASKPTAQEKNDPASPPAETVSPPAAENKEESAKTESPAVAESEEVKIPGFIAAAALGVELRDAELNYQDLVNGTNSKNKMNLKLSNLSLSRTSILDVSLDVDTRMAKVFTVKGPIQLHAEMTPTLKDSQIDQVQAEMKVTLDALDIAVPGVFQKSPSIPANLAFQAVFSQEKASLSNVKLVFHNAKIGAQAMVTELKSAAPVVDFSMKAEPIDLSSWQKLIPPMKDFDLSGAIDLSASANGPTDKLQYEAALALAKISATAPMLKGKPEINGNIQVKTDQVEKIDIRLAAPGTDFKISGFVKSFTAPFVKLSLVSEGGMDLDKLIDFPPPAAPTKTTRFDGQLQNWSFIPSAQAQKTAAPAAAEPPADLDAMVADLRKNPMLLALSLDISMAIKSIAMRGVLAQGIAAQLNMAKLVALLKNFSLSVFDGKVSASAGVNLAAAKPSYDFRADITGLELKKAVESQYQLFKNTLLGQASASVAGKGVSFNTEPALQNLDMKGNFSVKNGQFATVDINKMMAGGIKSANEAIDKASGTLKFLKGVNLNPRDVTGEYEIIKSDFSMKDNVFTAPNFVAQAKKDQGIDLKGFTRANLKKQTLDCRWEVHDKYNLAKADSLKVDIAGSSSPVLVKKGDHFWFPVNVKGTFTNPDYDYAELPEHFGKIVASNAKSAGTSAAVNAAINKAPAPVQKLLKKPKANKAIKKLLKF